MARNIFNILEEKLAEDILLLDLRGVSDFTDFFVLASGTSDRMLSSLSDSIVEKNKTDGLGFAVTEGRSNSGWMVLDYGSVVVHLLSPEKRDYYQLEDLWQKCKVILHLQ